MSRLHHFTLGIPRLCHGMFAITVLLSSVAASVCLSEKLQPEQQELRAIQKIVVLCDEYSHNARLKARSGFSCWIETEGQVILFDTGADGRVLLHNMNVMGLDPEAVDIVFLSRCHDEHSGGLDLLLSKNKDCCVYFLRAFPRDLKRDIEDRGARAVSVKKASEILPGVFTSGRMGLMIREQSLIIRTPDGLVIVTGSAHPGIIEVVERAKRMTGDEVDLVMGGFNLIRASRSKLGTPSLRNSPASVSTPAFCSTSTLWPAISISS